MKKFLMFHRLLNDKGLTLIELLASIVLITLLLTSFLMVFNQSAKTNIISENMVDGTYLAQEEMERVIGASKRALIDHRTAALASLGYGEASIVSIDDKQWLRYERSLERQNFKAVLRLENNVNPMSRAIVEIYDGSSVMPDAKMENILVWEVLPR